MNKVNAQLAAGILPFFDNGKTILLGQEYRKRDNSYSWMEFGGKLENGETLAETACREANEETGGTLGVTIDQVLASEQNGHYIDRYNEKSNVFYRMYCVLFEGEMITPESFKLNSEGKKHVGKVDWQYFDSKNVIYNLDGKLPGTEIPLYGTMQIRLKKLQEQDFLSKLLEKQN